jgi:hypothetical protein
MGRVLARQWPCAHGHGIHRHLPSPRRVNDCEVKTRYEGTIEMPPCNCVVGLGLSRGCSSAFKRPVQLRHLQLSTTKSHTRLRCSAQHTPLILRELIGSQHCAGRGLGYVIRVESSAHCVRTGPVGQAPPSGYFCGLHSPNVLPLFPPFP